MTEKEVKQAIQNIPIGSRVRLLRTAGDTIEVRLMSNEVDGAPEKNYGELVIPALPPAITVQGGSRFGNFRIELQEIEEVTQVD